MKKLHILLCAVLCAPAICSHAADVAASADIKQRVAEQDAWINAIVKGDLDTAQKLIDKPDFDPLLWLISVHHNNALGFALQQNRLDIALMMMKAASTKAYLRDANVLGWASRREALPVLRAMVADARFDPSVRRKGIPLLVNLAYEGNLNGVRMLLNHPKTDVTAKTDGGSTLLIAAVWSRAAGATALVLADKRIDPNETDESGQTALHTAVTRGRLNIDGVQDLLADPRVEVNLLDKKGNSSLALAIAQGWVAIAPFLKCNRVVISDEQAAQIDKARPIE